MRRFTIIKRERLTYGNSNHESENRETFGRDTQQVYGTGIGNSTTALFETVFKNLRSSTDVQIVTEEMTSAGELIHDQVPARFRNPKKTQSPRTSSLPKTGTKGFVFFTIPLRVQLGGILISGGVTIQLIGDVHNRNTCLIARRPGFDV